MDNILRFNTISEYNAFNNNETKHPLMSVVDLSKADPRQGSRMYFGFYIVFLKDVKCGDLMYGRDTYDYFSSDKPYTPLPICLKNVLVIPRMNTVH